MLVTCQSNATHEIVLKFSTYDMAKTKAFLAKLAARTLRSIVLVGIWNFNHGER